MKDQTFSFSNWLLNSQLQGPGGSRILLCLKDPEGLYFSFFVCILFEDSPTNQKVKSSIDAVQEKLLY